MGGILSRICVPLLHWFRLGGWVPPLLWLLYRFPLRGAFGVLFYYLILSRLPCWKALALRFATAGMDPRFHLIKHVEVDFVNKRYLVCVHPHGVYCDGVLYSMIFQKERFEKMFPGLKYFGAGADQVSYIPLFREILDGDKGKMIGVSKKELLAAFKADPKVSIGLCPGGFSEAVFADARNSVEYSYMKGRKGFIKLAIQAGVDIVPVYQFGVNKLYRSPRVWRGVRARWAQQLAIPMMIWWGWWGTSQPLDESQVYTVVGAPFPASQYSLAELDKAHADYCAAVQSLYDTYKDEFEMGNKPLVFIGKDFHDTDLPSSIFRRLGVHTSHIVPGEVPHRTQLKDTWAKKKKQEEEEKRKRRGATPEQEEAGAESE